MFVRINIVRLSWTVLSKILLYLFYVKPVSIIDWGLSTGEEGGAQVKWRENINDIKVRKLNNILINR